MYLRVPSEFGTFVKSPLIVFMVTEKAAVVPVAIALVEIFDLFALVAS
jgi:hypothetical protein